ncbi:(deoxy)nucleoside triphosphate pyrophosphohydrolase [Piscibacillus salipiscarius]|uniref:8-oxo-dGTP diphosphatase n=1 Tax=Piscibacillus salipiscarius TaxID=299480 RepID=A0ABW5Q9P0_9BACI
MKKDIFVVGAVIIKDGNILCAQRGIDSTLALKWEFPGGKIEKNESPQDALIREINEEFKCEVEIGEKVEQTVYEYDFGIVHLTTYYCKLVSGEPILTEHESIKWLKPEELSKLDWAPADIPAIKKIERDQLIIEKY